jgi:hypothetical protein
MVVILAVLLGLRLLDRVPTVTGNDDKTYHLLISIITTKRIVVMARPRQLVVVAAKNAPGGGLRR